MKVAVLRETNPNETRVGLVPDGVKFLKKKEIEVVVEKGAGLKAGFPDSSYEAEGATIAPDAAAAVAGRRDRPQGPSPVRGRGRDPWSKDRSW